MSVAEIVESSGKAQCRGYGDKCIVGKRFGNIPKGRKSLKISVYAAGGGATAFYCEECMKSVFDSFTKAMSEG